MDALLKREFCGKPVTLNGKPAVISGAWRPFALVRTLHDGGLTCAEYAWETAAKIIMHGGNFKA